MAKYLPSRESHYWPRLYIHEVISTESAKKTLTSTIWLTYQISRKFKNRSLQNFQPWQFTSLWLRKQQRNGFNGTVKSLNCLLTWEEKKSFVVFCWLVKFIAEKVCCVFFAWSADKNGGLVPRRKTSSSCSILCPIYLKRRISANICIQICLLAINFDVWAKFFLLTLSSRNGLFYANKREL